MTTITNETIIKAAKAAGMAIDDLDAYTLTMPCGREFDPLHNDTDNAMIMDGAEIDIEYDTPELFLMAKSYAWNGNEYDVTKAECEYDGNKSQARREAVILCAAAKYDAMNGDVK